MIHMIQKILYNVSVLWLILLLSACGKNIQQEDSMPPEITMEDTWQGQQEAYVPNEIAKNKMLRGREYYKMGKNKLALDILKETVAQTPEYADAHHLLALVYNTMNTPKGARWHYKKALSLKNNDPMLHNSYGQFLCHQQAWEAADKHFLSSAEHAKSQNWYPEIPYTNAGWCAFTYKNNISQAESYFRQALEHNSKYPRVLYLMAWLQYKEKKYEQARHYLEGYEREAKPFPPTLLLRIRIERALNNVEMEQKYTLYLRQNFPLSQEALTINQSTP